MDAAYDAEQWHDLAVAMAGAGAALAGLLIVAASINLREIVSDATLPKRAAAALVLLTNPIFLALALLVPAISRSALGGVLLGIGAAGVAMLTWFLWPRFGPEVTVGRWLVGSALPAALSVVPTVLAGAGLLTTSLGGLYWLPIGIAASIAGGLLQAWVLLIEILR